MILLQFISIAVQKLRKKKLAAIRAPEPLKVDLKREAPKDQHIEWLGMEKIRELIARERKLR